MRQKCPLCKKKIKLLGFECKCGYTFCSTHRLPEDHHCTFDHKTFEKKNLNNAIYVKCNFVKVEKI
jgi:predicted nucleic acid binding AN1-type Zn finger protein